MVAPNLITPFIKHELHGGPVLFSIIEGTCSIGMVVGAIIIPALTKRIGWLRCLFFTITGISVCLLIFSLNHLQSIAVGIYFTLGFCYNAWSLSVSQAQERMPKAQQGRIQAVMNTVGAILVLGLYLILQGATHTPIVHEYWYFTAFGLVGLLVLQMINKKEAVIVTTE